MRQVPEGSTFYGIVGDGRASLHVQHYFRALNLPFQVWSRQSENIDPAELFSDCHTILVLLKDTAIQHFILSQPKLKTKHWVHFSGALCIPEAQSTHPLMSFGAELYDITTYHKIPFICEAEKTSFTTLFPHLSNPHYNIPAQLKSQYHSLCVLAGNFTTVLWQKFFSELENTFSLPKAAAFPYLQKIAENLQRHPESALTGPFARRDYTTIQKNLHALEGDDFQKVYQAFAEVLLKKAGTHEYS